MSGTGSRIEYDITIADSICDEIAAGKNLARLCKQPGFPCRSTIYVWLKEHEDFMDKYAHAKKMQLEHMIDDVIEMSDDCKLTSNNMIDVMTSRLQIDTRKWYISKLAPKIPSLDGSAAHQSQQIISAYANGDLNEERAKTLTLLLNSHAAFVPMDVFQQEMRDMKEQLLNLKISPESK